jgi:hypothetical protein
VLDNNEWFIKTFVFVIENVKFLNQRSLPFIETQKQIAEIKTNSQILAQATRTGTSFFAQLPSETLIKIASLTGDKEIIPEHEANKIAYVNFDRPKLDA